MSPHSAFYRREEADLLCCKLLCEIFECSPGKLGPQSAEITQIFLSAENEYHNVKWP